MDYTFNEIESASYDLSKLLPTETTTQTETTPQQFTAGKLIYLFKYQQSEGITYLRIQSLKTHGRLRPINAQTNDGFNRLK